MAVPRYLCPLVAAFTLVAPVTADDTAGRQRVADQRAEAQVRDGLKTADLYARTSAAEGVRSLRALLVALDLDGAVSANKRLTLTQQIQDKIALLEGRPSQAVTDAKLAKLKAEVRAAVEAGLAESKVVKETVAEVAKLYGSGRANEARVKVAALAKRYPTNPAVLVLEGQGALSDRLAEAHNLAREQNDRFTLALNDVQRSALPAKKDMELAPDWKQRQELRDRLKPRLGPDEERILAALDKPANPVANMPFEEVLQSLSTLSNQSLYIDEPSLDAVGADKRRPVTLPTGVSIRTALRIALQSQGLTFVIKDKAIVVLSLEKARESLVTRSYYLGEAVAAGFGGAIGLGPVLDAQQTVQNAQLIIDAIKRGVDPMVWSDKSGPASITFHYPSLSIIVRAPAEVQAGLSSKLK